MIWINLIQFLFIIKLIIINKTCFLLCVFQAFKQRKSMSFPQSSTGMLPSFANTQQLSPIKQSPSKSKILKPSTSIKQQKFFSPFKSIQQKHLSSSNKPQSSISHPHHPFPHLTKNHTFLNKFIQSKITQGLKLNNLNQINSMHSSVYNSAVNQSKEFMNNRNNILLDQSNNTMRNVVGLSYFNDSGIGLSKRSGDESLVGGLLDKKQTGQSIRNKVHNNNQSAKNKKKQFLRSTPNNNHQKGNPLSLNKIRSRSSSQLSIQQSPHPIKPLLQQQNPPPPSLISPLLKRQLQLSNKPLQQQIQQLLIQHYNRNFIKDLIAFMNKNWQQNQASLLQDKRIQMLINIIVQKFSYLNDIVNDFMSTEFVVSINGNQESGLVRSYLFDQQANSISKNQYSPRQLKLLSSVLFKQCQKTIINMRKLFEQLVSKLPQDGIVQQQFILQQLKKNLLQIYDPKYTYSSAKMKQRFSLYYEVYCSKRTNLQTQIKHKLKPELSFIKSMEEYLSSYQKQLMKMKGQITNLEKQKEHLMELLRNKTTFKPIQINLKELAEMKQQATNKIKQDFQVNIVEFHKKWHEKDSNTIDTLKDQCKKLKKQVQQKEKEKQYHIMKLEDYLKSIPKTKDASTQIFNLPSMDGGSNSNPNQSNKTHPISTKQSQSLVTSSPNQLSLYTSFLQNIITPFTFNQKITSSLISIISIDKILYDFQPIKHKLPLISFRHYLFEWFIIRTGSKKISQILLKNFIYSIKKYRNKHKRFSIFNKIIGYSGLRKKNLQEDIQFLFYQTNLAWYYIVKLALIYRKKLNDNPSGYHIYPPIHCQQIFKLSLRKSYQLIQQFFAQQSIPVPQNLSQKIDHYAINQISKFKQNDEDFQKQSLQQIHILREMNFDIIVGFVLDYAASEKSIMLEGLLRSVYLKQQEEKSVIGYGDFEAIYRKYNKEKRSKIQLIYSKFCLCNMWDVLNADNMTPVIILILEDEVPLRTLFEKNQTLKACIVPEKGQSGISPSKNQKKPHLITALIPQANYAFQHFRQKYYQQFYDFYDITIMLEQIFKIIKVLVRKRLKKLLRQQKYIQSLLQIPKYQTVGQTKLASQQSKQIQNNYQSQNQQQSSSQQQNQPQKASTKPQINNQILQKLIEQKTYIEQKLQQWNKIQQRIPHFTNQILTIDQILIHNMRRKEMLEGCEFAWRTLREILVVISK